MTEAGVTDQLRAENARLRAAISAAIVAEGCSCSDTDEPERTCPMHQLEAALTPDYTDQARARGKDRLHGIVRHYVDEADRILDGLAERNLAANVGGCAIGEAELAKVVIAFAEMRRALYDD